MEGWSTKIPSVGIFGICHITMRNVPPLHERMADLQKSQPQRLKVVINARFLTAQNTFDWQLEEPMVLFQGTPLLRVPATGTQACRDQMRTLFANAPTVIHNCRFLVPLRSNFPGHKVTKENPSAPVPDLRLTHLVRSLAGEATGKLLFNVLWPHIAVVLAVICLSNENPKGKHSV